MAVPVIRALKSWYETPSAVPVIRDAPPGTSCPVVETMRGSNYVVLVTEPTPFGLHDLKLAVELTKTLGIPAGVVVNRDGVGDQGVDCFCRDEDLPILMRIPLDERIGQALSQGELLIEAFPEYKPHFQELFSKICAFVDRKMREESNVMVGL
jgi:MinD superfamily P-loop ATPase